MMIAATANGWILTPFMIFNTAASMGLRVIIGWGGQHGHSVGARGS